MSEPWKGWSIAVERVCTEPHKTDTDLGIEGYVIYLLLKSCNDTPRCAIVCEAHLEQHHHYLRQPFARGGPRHYKGASKKDIDENRANIWGLDGPAEMPTLSPSFLFEGHTHPRNLYPDWPRVHSYMRAGRLELLADSDAVLAEHVPCRSDS